MAIDDFIEPQGFVEAPADGPLGPDIATHYNAQGYAILRGWLSADDLDAIRPDVERLVAESHRRQKDIHLKSMQVGRLMKSDRVRGALEAVNGPSTLLQSFAFTKLPHEVRTKHWHQDGVYWGLSDSRVCCMFIPMTETTVDNGCIWFVPGTHRLGRMHHHVATDEFGLENLECDIAAFRDPVPMLLQPGDAVIAHTYMVHASFHNRTDRPRISLGFHFRNLGTELHLPAPYRREQERRLGRDPAAA